MANTEKSNTYSIIAAICFSFAAVCSVVIQLIFSSQYSYYYSLSFSAVLEWILLIALAVTLFIKNKLAVIIASGAYTLYILYWLVFNFCLYTLVCFIACIAVVVLLILSITNNKTVKEIWFIGGALFFLSAISGWIQWGYFSSLSYVFSDISVLINTLFMLVEAAAFLFMGLWLKECVSPVEYSPVNGYAPVNYQPTYTAPAGYGSAGQVNGYAPVNYQPTYTAPTGYGAGQVNGYAAVNPQATYAAPADYGSTGAIEKLNMCKTLLDAGAITQEEFDAKKKEILGL